MPQSNYARTQQLLSLCSRAQELQLLSSIPGWGRSPGEGNGNPLQYSCLGKSHGQRSLVGYSPWGHKELDRTQGVNKKKKY